MANKITDIHCPSCGAPAAFDIVRQKYVCGYCGSNVGIREAQKEKQGFRRIRAARLRSDLQHFRLFTAYCSGCGATVVFEENDASQSCAFCGRSLLRKEYLDSEGIPECVIPFRLTEAEARQQLADWCNANPKKPESAHLRPFLDRLRGFYLPYELVRGPVHMRVSRMDGGAVFPCEGFLNDEFVSRSKQLDNLLLDGMEPFDITELTEFDFAFVAGHRVKISDIPDDVLERRTGEEAGASYTPAVRKTLETQAIEVSADVSSALRLPVLLPVYYISEGPVMAAVNGQTGKVSVRAEKESHYYFLPWWLKAIIATLIFCVVSFAAFRLFGMDTNNSLFITGILGVFFIMVTLCVYSDTVRNKLSVNAGYEIFTSRSPALRRAGGRLVPEEADLSRRMAEPVFLRKINGKEQPVILRFTTPLRVFRMALLCTVVIFLPVIIALFLNGFNFSRLTLGGSAAWFCIAVPIVPIYLLKFGIVELYEKPWIYQKLPDGRRKRIKEKRAPLIDRELAHMILRAVFVPPASLAVWFGILCFVMTCYLTAFGFD